MSAAARADLTALAEFAADPALDLSCVTMARADPAPEARALSLRDAAETYFRDVITNRVLSTLDPLAWNLRKLDAVYKPDPGDLEWRPLDELPPVQYAIAKMANPSSLAPFTAQDAEYKRRLLYRAMGLRAADGRAAHFFRAFSAAAELERKRGAAFVLRDGTFDRVRDAIFLIDDQIDCFVFGEHVFVSRKREYRKIFDQMNEVLRRAKSAAGDLHRRVPIANFAEFERACSTDARLADKVLAVRSRPYFDQLSYEMVRPVIEEFSLDIPTETQNGKTLLVFRTDPANRTRILRLVDDDFLRSSMTAYRYEVNSKSEPGAV